MFDNRRRRGEQDSTICGQIHPASRGRKRTIAPIHGKTVTFWYEDREGVRHFVTMEVRAFMRALIQHIPDRNFKMIRYYGAYCRRTKRSYSGYLQRSIRQATFEDFVTNVNTWAPKCPRCGRKMTFVCYEKGPPIEDHVFGCKLADWNHPWLKHG